MTILEDLERLEEEISATGKTVSGELVIGASTIPGAYLLPGLAAAFKNEFPGISFEIRINDSAKIVEAVASNELFLGIVGAKIANAKLNFQLFAEDKLILAAADTNAVQPDITIKELCKLPFIVREQGSGTRKSTETLLAQQHLTLSHLNTCASIALTEEAMRKGSIPISRKRVIAPAESLVCRVEKTRWPVSAD